MTMQAYPEEGGEAIAYGATITSDGVEAFYLGVVRVPKGSSPGRIAAIRPGPNWPNYQEPTLKALLADRDRHSWPERGAHYAEYLPHVYGLVIR